MELLNFENKINVLNPIEKLHLLNKEYGYSDLCVMLIQTLKAVEDVLSKYSNKKLYIYLQDEYSIKWLLDNCLEYEIFDKDFFNAIYLLDLSKMIYRFNCAMKFHVENEAVYQLRINEWGRKFFSEHKNNVYEVVKSFFQDYCYENKKVYKSIFTMLENKYIDKEVADEIKKFM